MKYKRNDPCPCGSGKKYKKCCLNKEIPPTSSQDLLVSSSPTTKTPPSRELPSISILLPTRNRSRLLSESLECLVNQRYPKLQVVVVDDNSDDDTPAVVESYQTKLPGLIYSRNEVQIGGALGFRRAAELANGDYLLNFSDDDLLSDGALFAFADDLTARNHDIIYSDLDVIDGDGNHTQFWTYKDYPDRTALLKALMDAGGNVIPETALVKRDRYNELYGELYGLRFITPFYLGALNRLSMKHIAQPIFRYRVHQDSTFKDASGLVVRNKGVLNFMNLIMFKYRAHDIFSTQSIPDRREAIVESIIHCIVRLLHHAKRFISGTFYTGAQYKPEDRLYMPFYEMAYHWLMIARKYNVLESKLDQLEKNVRELYDPRQYDLCKINMLPDVYRKLPWFSYRPINDVSDFIAFDMITLGTHALFDSEEQTLYKDGKVNIRIVNHFVDGVDELLKHMETHPAQVVNISDEHQLLPVIRALENNGYYFLCVANFTSHRVSTDVLVKNIIDFDPTKEMQLDGYLAKISLV